MKIVKDIGSLSMCSSGVGAVREKVQTIVDLKLNIQRKEKMLKLLTSNPEGFG